MLIKEITLKNFKSFGNNEQSLKLNTEKGELILLMGRNGNGKSVIDETEIDVKIPIENMNLKELNEFLGIMGMGSEYIKCIKENNISLYEQYVNQQKTT